MWGDAGLHKQINTTSVNIQNVIPGEGITKTFQKNKTKKELLEHILVKNAMIYTQAENLGAGVRRK